MFRLERGLHPATWTGSEPAGDDGLGVPDELVPRHGGCSASADEVFGKDNLNENDRSRNMARRVITCPDL